MVKLTTLAATYILISTVIIINGHQGQEDEVNVDRHTHTVMCYIQRWARYRTGDGHFDVNQFNPNLCTHVVYYFVGLNNISYKIESLDPTMESNIDEGGEDGFKSIINLKKINPRLKTLVSIGGYDQGSKRFSDMAFYVDRRRIFVDSVVAFLKKYKFDGLVVDWRYPARRDGKPEDKQNFVTLLKELRSAFRNNDWVLAVMLKAPVYGYDLPQISEIVDLIIMNTLDFHGDWDKKTGHNSPLYQRKDDVEDNCNHTIQSFIAMGGNRRKMNLVVPTYGRTFTLDDPKNTAVGAPANKEAPKGNWTNEPGFISYFEVCQEVIDSSMTIRRDREQHVPYAFKGDTWISYDDPISIKEKVEYAVSNYLSGVAVFAIDTDDMKGRCHGGTPMYLLTTINKVFEKAYIESLNVKPQHVDDQHSINKNEEHPKSGDASSKRCSLTIISMIILSWMLHIR